MKRALPLLLLLVTACSVVPGQPDAPQLSLAPPEGRLAGLVVGLDGEPLAGAQVRTSVDEAVSAADGTFDVAAPAAPEWVSVTADGHLPRTEAGVPGRPLLSRLTPQDGQTVSLRFGGDVMAGRRFYRRDTDGSRADALLPAGAGVDDHLALLEDVRPLLEQADLTVVNLESPLTGEPDLDPTGPRPAEFQQTKEFVFSSAPALADALAEAGVDVIDLGNNHMYDRLDGGVRTTIEALDAAGLVHYGAGQDLDEAWRPARVEVRGQALSFVGCTTITGEDDPTPYIATDTRAGAAGCEAGRLAEVVRTERASGATVIASIHGGFEYGREQSRNVRALSEVARDAGALLVVDHHPHVIGGFTATDEGGLIADTLGNLLFDQEVWSTFPSYLLSTDLRDGRLVRARTEPLVVDGYVPRGTVGALADVSDRFAAVLGAGEGTFGPHGAEIVPGGPVRQERASADLLPGQVRRLAPGWTATTPAGPGLQLGQELLWTGGFEDEETGSELGAALWDLDGSSVSLRPDAARSGAQGVRLLTTPAASGPSLLTTEHRVVLPNGRRPVTFTGWVRGSTAAELVAEIHWYGDTKGPSSSTLAEVVPVSEGWQEWQVESVPPAGTVAAQVFLRLLPTAEDDLHVAVDDVQLVQWEAQGTAPTPLHGALRALGTPRTEQLVARLPAGGERLPGWISGNPLLDP